MRLRNILAVIGTCALAAFSTASSADLLFQITSDHCTGGCLTGQTSGGTIVVHDNGGGSLTFTVSLLNGNQFIQTGQDATFAFNLGSIPSISYSGLTAGWAAVGGANPVANGDLHMDGTGFFDYGVTCIPVACGGGGGSPAGSSLTFTVAAAGLDLTDLTANADGQFFGMDIISGTTGLTGFVDASVGTVCTPPVCTPQQTPEPATLALLGIALLGMSVPAIRRRRNNR